MGCFLHYVGAVVVNKSHLKHKCYLIALIFVSLLNQQVQNVQLLHEYLENSFCVKMAPGAGKVWQHIVLMVYWYGSRSLSLLWSGFFYKVPNS